MSQFIWFMRICLSYIYLQHLLAVEAKTVFHRINKISDDMNKQQQQNLLAEQIDPNVAPSYINSVTANVASMENIEEDAAAAAAGAAAGAAADAGDGNDDYIPVDEFVDEMAHTTAMPLAVNDMASQSVTPTKIISSTTSIPIMMMTTTTTTTIKPTNDLNGLAKYCKCSDDACDCCRNFNIPFLPIKGPGCARIRYLNDDRLSLSLKYGDITLASRTINSRRTKPICVNLPGGYSSFCSRIYGVSKATSNFKACLGFELRADDEVEAALRVSCFKFGPEGLKVVEAEPFPTPVKSDEDDDDYPFGFAAGGDDDDDDDDDDEDDDYDEYNEDDEDNEEHSANSDTDTDYGGFSLDALFDDDDDDTDDNKVEIQPVTNAINVEEVQSKDDTDIDTIHQISNEIDNATNKLERTSLALKKVKTKTKKEKSNDDSTETEMAYDIINSLFEMFN